jgi:N6-adenosine-specific RNA methylase IME4
MKYNVIVCDPPWQFSDKLQMSDVRRGASSNYQTMSMDDIKALPIKSLADDNGCILCIWCPSVFLKDGIEMLEKNNFQLKQTYVWCKIKKEPLEQVSDLVSDAISTLDDLKSLDTKSFKAMKKTIGGKVLAYKNKLTDMLGFGMGHLFRQTHELCIIGINNTGIYKHIENKSQRSVCFSVNEGHSIKPDVFQDSLEALFGDQDVNKCELFGRRKRKGWDVIGNECPGSIGIDIEASIRDLIAK